MSEERAIPAVVATFAKRQRLLAIDHHQELRGEREEGPVHKPSHWDEDVQDEHDGTIGTPEVEPRKAAVEQGAENSPTPPAFDPQLKAYFELVDKEELLVEQQSDDEL